MRNVASALLGALTLSAASAVPVLAQTAVPGTISLADGRSLTLPTGAQGCSSTGIQSLGSGFAIGFECLTMGSAQVLVIVATPPMDRSPRALLLEEAGTWQADFASWPADQQSTFLNTQNRRLSGGGRADFVCLSYDNVAALSGSSHCILDQPAAQLIVTAEANMASDADRALNAVMAAIVLR